MGLFCAGVSTAAAVRGASASAKKTLLKTTKGAEGGHWEHIKGEDGQVYTQWQVRALPFASVSHWLSSLRPCLSLRCRAATRMASRRCLVRARTDHATRAPHPL